MDRVLVNKTVSSADIGLICSTSNQLIVGNPLQKIGYGDSTNKFLKPMKYRENVNAIKLNCAERFVAFAANSLAIFDLEREIAIRQLHEHDGSVTDVAWHNSSPYQLASVCRDDSTLRTWDVRSHPAQVSVRRLHRPFSRLQFSPDCNFVACSGESISIFDLNAAQSVVTEIAFNPTECLLASASEDRLVRFWDVDTGECVTQSLPFESVIQRLKFHPDGKYLICATQQNLSAIVWEPFDLLYQTPKMQYSILPKPTNEWSTLDLSIYGDDLLQLCGFSESLNNLENETMRFASILLTAKPLTVFEKCANTSATIAERSKTVKNDVCQFNVVSNIATLCRQSSDLSVPTPTSAIVLPTQISYATQLNSTISNFVPTFLSSFSCASSISSTSPAAEEKLLGGSFSVVSRLPFPLADLVDGPTTNDKTFSENGDESGDGRTSVTSLTLTNNPEFNKNENCKSFLKVQALTTMPHSKTILMEKNLSMAALPSGDQLSTTLPSHKFNVSSTYSLSPALSNSKISGKLSLKQSRSKSCGVPKALSNLSDTKHSVGTTTTKSSKLTIRRLSITTAAVKPDRKTITDTHNDLNDVTKVNNLLQNSEKIRVAVKRRTTELNNFLLYNYEAHGVNACETMVGFAAKQEDLRIFACLLKSYLDHPKFYSLNLNIKFLEKIRNLFAHQNTQYLVLALSLLEMIVRSFGNSIRHGLAANSFSLGVDVAAEQRFERCTRCRNLLLEVQLNSSFFMDRLTGDQKSSFKDIILQMEKIIDS